MARKIASVNVPDIFSELEDSARIKANTMRYRDMSIEDAFNDFYGKKTCSCVAEPPISVNINDYVKARIVAITKRTTEFEAVNVKGRLISKVDLSRTPDIDTSREYTVKIVERTKDGWIVDPWAPMFDAWIDENLKTRTPVTVTNLKLVQGGYTARVRVDSLSTLTSSDVYVDAFIPGSQIVLNIERNFAKWNGATVTAFIDGYTRKPQSNEMCVICSVKKYLQSIGDMTKIEWFKAMTENTDAWKQLTQRTLEGVVTGVICTAEKCGVFVELPQYNITTLINAPANELTKYHPTNVVNVRVVNVDSPTYFDDTMQQMQHIIPYRIENGKYVDVKLNVEMAFA